MLQGAFSGRYIIAPLLARLEANLDVEITDGPQCLGAVAGELRDGDLFVWADGADHLRAAVSGLGMMITINAGAATLGTPIFGYIVDRTGSYSIGWQILAAAIAVGTFAMAILLNDTARKY